MVPDLEQSTSQTVSDRRLVRGSTVVTLTGELDIADQRLLRRMLTRMPAAPLPHVVVDLREVDFLDCSVLRTFVSAHNAARLEHGCLRVAAPQGEPLRLLRLSRLDRVLCLHPTLIAAVRPECPTHAPTG
jgi:anti-sigma B factor antagonist